MPLDDAAWLERQRACTPDDKVRAIIFQGVLRGVRERCGDEAAGRCGAGLGEAVSDALAWLSVRDFLELLASATCELAPRSGGVDGALRELGAASVRAASEHRVGKTALSLVSHSPRTWVNFFPGLYRIVTTYGQRTVTWEDEKCAVIEMKRDFSPVPYHEGTLRLGLEAIGLEEVSVTGREIGRLDAEYRLTWRSPGG